MPVIFSKSKYCGKLTLVLRAFSPFPSLSSQGKAAVPQKTMYVMRSYSISGLVPLGGAIELKIQSAPYFKYRNLITENIILFVFLLLD